MAGRETPTENADEITGETQTHAVPPVPREDPAEEIGEKGEPSPGNFA